MALTCDAFGATTPNTYRNTMQSANCQDFCTPQYPLPPDNFRAALLTGLVTIAANQGLTINLGSIPPADIEAAMYNLNCAIEGAQLRFPDIDNDKWMGIAVYLINQILCAGI